MAEGDGGASEAVSEAPLAMVGGLPAAHVVESLLTKPATCKATMGDGAGNAASGQQHAV